MKNLPAYGLFIVLILSACKDLKPVTEASSFYLDFNRVKSYPSNLPEDYTYTDYGGLAKAYHRIVFDFDAQGPYLPFIREDETYNSIGIAAYVGDGRRGSDGSQEAVTVLAAALSASLNGIDMADYRGRDYFPALNAFFSKAEGVILNNPGGRSADTSMWYVLYPAILYTQLSLSHDNQAIMRTNTLTTIESWYSAYEIIRDQEQFDFDLTGFDFIAQKAYRNGIWKEPDAAVGMAILFHYGYILTKAEKYLDAVFSLMDYIEGYFGGPLYELLLYYAPVMTAELNALYGTHYDSTKALNRVFDGNSIPRGGWGSLSGKWGDYEVNGLFGSKTDGGGYAFSMNTFAAAGAIAPLARYDTRYARSIGKWLLHLHSNGRYFFSTETAREHQSLFTAAVQNVPSAAIRQAVPYEGIRNRYTGKSPWFGGDPTVYGWAETDLSLYSGAHTGIPGALFEQTNQTGILKVDLCATDVTRLDAWPTYLVYNPWQEDREVNYTVQGGEGTDLFDAVTNTIAAGGIIGNTFLTIPAEGAMVIVEIPSGKPIKAEGQNYFVEDRYISSIR
ncbi:hypothetical protein FACS1894141_6110 [Spirochaetia bacterium]|nr:hypothetical protein FACS1894141_6110 [Spirochaetia bacterium]